MSDERLFHTAKFLDTALRNAGEERDCDERLSHILRRASVSVGSRFRRPQVRTLSDERFSHIL